MSKVACASHILVKTDKQAQSLKAQIESGSNFASLAQNYSTCSSAKKGGDLGEFRKGAMVAQFDKAVFANGSENQKVLGPIKTKFGYHLIQVLYKS